MKLFKKIIYTLLALLLATTVALVGIILFAEYRGKRFEPKASTSDVVYPDDESRLAYDENGNLEELPTPIASEEITDETENNSSSEGNVTPAETSSPNEDTTTSDESAGEEHTYILNKESSIFHYETCPDVQNISEENRSSMTSTRDIVIGRGYEPCGNCNP